MDILVLHIKILKLFCLWPVERSKSTIVLRTTVIVVTFITALFPTAATIRQFLVNFEDEAVVTDDLIAIMNCFCGFFVYVCFLTKMHDVKKYVEGIKVFLQFCPADVIERFLTYLITGLGLNSLIPVIGYRSCIQRRPDSDHDPCGLPIRVWFPFDVSTSTFYYYVIFFLVNHTCVHVCGVILITTLSLVAFLMHISAQIHVLKENLVKVFENIQEDNENSNLKLEAQLKTCIKYHSAIIK
ncbi:unnamed protein product [Callosobruchus maculatus]|uniref:Odorant receptor n=1 Tax=Callosobruchus maculatus TaxID=64391 RepID=A0A653BWC1_CALMS|nr:unnamed protein product [Callosobruchus maculatus]